ncbi:MAG: hypothetical protein ABR498_05780 [Candidatus Dormibacteria bacterium]
MSIAELPADGLGPFLPSRVPEKVDQAPQIDGLSPGGLRDAEPDPHHAPAAFALTEQKLIAQIRRCASAMGDELCALIDSGRTPEWWPTLVQRIHGYNTVDA